MSFDSLEFGEGLFLSGVKGDLFAGGGRRRGSWGRGDDGGWCCRCDGGWGCGFNGCIVNSGGGSGSGGRFFATIFFDAEREKKVGGFGDWI